MKIKTKKPDSKWLKLARERGFTLKTGPKKMSALKEMLLEVGGWAVCIPHVESDLKKLLKRGGRFTGSVKMMKGEPCAIPTARSAGMRTGNTAGSAQDTPSPVTGCGGSTHGYTPMTA